MDDDNDSDVGDLLEDLLSNTDGTEKETLDQDKQSTPKRDKRLTELNFNFLDSVPSVSNGSESSGNKNLADIHEGDTDSSDDEDKRYFEEQKYSDYGRQMKDRLKKNAPDRSSCDNVGKERDRLHSFDFNRTKESGKSSGQVQTASYDVYSDPIFGLRIVKPLISSSELKERMNGRTPVTVSRVKNHIATGDLNNDWVIAGVLISKSPIRTSQKGSQYCIWKISDLSSGIKTVGLFLFGGAYKGLWKTTTGTVIGVLNPGVLDNKDDVDQACLSVDNPQRVMILGNSKDMGVCKSIKKNGEPCSAIVNLGECEYCVYHVKQEYNKCSRRSELQSSTGSRGLSSLDSLKNKVLGKGETIYGGRSFTAVPAKRNLKQVEKDRARMSLLTGARSSESAPKVPNDHIASKKKASLVELTNNQMKKDIDRLSKLRNYTSISEPILSKSPTLSAPVSNSNLSTATVSKPNANEKLSIASLSKPTAKANSSTSSLRVTRDLTISKNSTVMAIPQLGAGSLGGLVNLSEPVTKKRTDMAKINAVKWIQRNGTIKQNNPNKVRLGQDEKLERGVKRQRETDENSEQNAKKQNPLADRFKQMIEATSNHTDLIEIADDKEKEKYFNKLEMKEKMEEKMMTTFKVDCKAVKCLICKYTAFSGSDLCKEQKHPLRVIDAVKRFFKCSDCGNRTVCLDRIPSHSCKNCSSSNWARAAMMDEKRTNIPGTTLSIRGGEEKFIGSSTKEANLNLLVPDSE